MGSGRSKKVSTHAEAVTPGAEAFAFEAEDAFHGLAAGTEPSLINVNVDDVASVDTAQQLAAKLEAVQRRAREQAKTIAELTKKEQKQQSQISKLQAQLIAS